jgi:hypothetical protein
MASRSYAGSGKTGNVLRTFPFPPAFPARGTKRNYRENFPSFPNFSSIKVRLVFLGSDPLSAVRRWLGRILGFCKVIEYRVRAMSDNPKRKRRSRSTTCTVCRHPDRVRIEANRLVGVMLKDLAREFGLSIPAIWRHMREHVSAEAKAEILADVPLREIAERAAKEGMSLLDYYGIVRGTVFKQLIAAGSINDRPAVATLAGRAVDVLESIGKLTGELRQLAPQSVTNNTAIFVNSPVFVQLEEMLVKRLAPHPAALKDVLEGLNELAGSAPEGVAMPLRGPPAAIEHEVRP